MSYVINSRLNLSAKVILVLVLGQLVFVRVRETARANFLARVLRHAIKDYFSFLEWVYIGLNHSRFVTVRFDL